jgi:cytochrome c peroxidase
VFNKYKKLDADLKFELTKAEIHRNSFKTPTINIELTAPYMHNGVFKTLEVIDFIMTVVNGLGFNLQNQTLPEDKLNLKT